MKAKTERGKQYKQVLERFSWVSRGEKREAMELVTNKHSCQICAFPVTKLADLCHLSR